MTLWTSFDRRTKSVLFVGIVALLVFDATALARGCGRGRRHMRHCCDVTTCCVTAPARATPVTAIEPGIAALPEVAQLESKDPTVKYHVLRSEFIDDDEEHDRPDPAADCPPDNFCGTARKKAKTSVASAPNEFFSNLDDLLDSLEDDDDMIDRDPPISHGAASDRVSEEKRNVTVDAFLYAATGEDDNDYHLIIGNDLSGGQRRYMNVEISGLPASGQFRAPLKEARDQFKDFFEDELPGHSYDFYNPPIPVRISGSLFYDIDHSPGAVGPQGRKPKTSWEIHPITNIEFEP
jgi:hypothetical protein